MINNKFIDKFWKLYVNPRNYPRWVLWEYDPFKNKTIICLFLFYFSNVLRENGSVVDAGVAAMFCNGVLDQPHMGLGGGSVMTIYER